MSSQSVITDFSNSRSKMPKKGIWTSIKRIVGFYPRSGPVPLEKKDVDKLIGVNDLPYDSFMPFVPYQRYDKDSEQVYTPDGKRAVFLNILPADIEGRNETIIEDIAEKISIAFENIPSVSPQWIIQIYINDEPMDALIHEVTNYFNKYNKYYGREKFEYQDAWLEVLNEHYKLISKRDGIFKDNKSRLNWRGKFRRVRLVIYKNSNKVSEDELNSQTLRLVEGLNEAGIRSTRMAGKNIFEWLMPWLSGEREKAYEYFEKGLYPEEEELNGTLPPSFDLGSMCLNNKTVQAVNYVNEKGEKEPGNNHWKLGDRFCRYITLKPYTKIPKAGLWNAETSEGSAPFDRMPDGSILATTIVIEPQDIVEGHLQNTIAASIGDGKDAELTETECNKALVEMVKNNKLITWMSGIYIDADTLPNLNKVTTKATAAANATNYEVIDTKDDLLGLDNFVRRLPMAFDPVADKETKRDQGRLVWDSHATRLFPLFCRGRGTRNPGLIFNSRVGEPISFDPLSGDDREKNAHLLLLGPTGSGKTATLVTMLLQVTAVHNPKLFLITSLPTFSLLGDYYESLGITVNKIQISPKSPPSLPPFADITKLIKDKVNEEEAEDSVRDILSEAELSARLMITGGDPEEEKRLLKEDKALIKLAILQAAKNVFDEGREQALTEDVVKAMKQLGQDEEYNQVQRHSLMTRASVMEMYTKGFDGLVFNREGKLWKDVDVTIVELGVYAKEDKKDQMAIAITGLLDKINNIAEDNQNSKRNIITLIDEANDPLSNDLVVSYLSAKAAKGRTFASWLWISTQNLHQFPDSADALLAQPEWWIMLNTEKDDIKQLKRFKNLTDEQEALLESARKQKNCFTEGVVMSKRLLTLFRNVPPALALALAQTEKDERAHRFDVQQEQKCSQLEAAIFIADKEINDRRRKHMA